jgi:hypothetical protein
VSGVERSLKRLLVVVALVFAGGVVAAANSASSALFFLFDPTTARPGEQVTVRTAWTPQRFRPSQQAKPLRPPMRLYLVPNAVAGAVRSRFDKRIHFIGSIRPDRDGRGVLAFNVPALDSGSYAAAAWCPGCAHSSRGRTFSVLGVRPETAGQYRPLMLLRVATPPATAETCPVTIPSGGRTLGPMPARHGNGLLWTGLPRDGTVAVDADRVGPDGYIFWTKLIWIARGVHGDLEVQVQRLDAPAPVLSPDVVSGRLSGWFGPSWASRMRFSSAGCWRVTGRVDDVSLSFVVKVVGPRPPRA